MCLFRATRKTEVFVCFDSFATILLMEIISISWISMIQWHTAIMKGHGTEKMFVIAGSLL